MSFRRPSLLVAAAVALIATPLVFAAIGATLFYVWNHNNGSIISAGEKRAYLLHVPASYDPARPAPLVISLHGAGGWPAQQRHMSEWDRTADREGFIVVYPGAVRGPGPRIWRVGPGAGLARDVRFIGDLIDRIAADYTIDRNRIYVNGFSNGGGMTFVLSCTLADRIAAVGAVGAAQTLPWSWCKEQHPLPMIAFHGTGDRFAPYQGGPSPVAPDSEPFPNIPKWVAMWGRRNRCAVVPMRTEVAADVERTTYVDCPGGADVVFYSVRGGGHQWFGGRALPTWFVGPQSNSVDATEVMWAFFRAHPRVQRP